MEIEVRPGRSIHERVDSFERSHASVLGLVVDGGDTAPRKPQAGDIPECECPYDCLRDHENE